jgi:sec-independent protein translocase protein TatA
MGSFSIWHWIIVLAVVLLLFGGRGKISQLMGDFGKGLSAFKKGVGTPDETPPAQAGQPGDTAADLGAGYDLAAGRPGPPGYCRQGLMGSRPGAQGGRVAHCHVRHRQP